MKNVVKSFALNAYHGRSVVQTCL